MLRASGRRVAAICDELLGKDEVVVKPLGPLLASLPHYLGAAILGDGSIALLARPGRRSSRGTADARLAASARQRRSLPDASARPHGVLVVEDSLAVRELQRSILEAAGYRVETARDGREALERLGSDETIELVVTDVEMPEMDGLELTRRSAPHPTLRDAARRRRHLARRGGGPPARHRGRRRRLHGQAGLRPAGPARDRRAARRPVSDADARVRRVLDLRGLGDLRRGLSRLLERDREIDVIGVCETAEQAIARLPALKPDLVTMDLELPGMSGVDAIEQIMGVLPVPILVLSGHVERRSQTALHALAAGALDALPKADLDLGDPDGAAAQALRQRVKVLSGVKVIRHPRAPARAASGAGLLGAAAPR